MGLTGELPAAEHLAVLGKWQLREEAQETQRFGLLEEKNRGTETEKVGQDSVTKAAGGSL